MNCCVAIIDTFRTTEQRLKKGEISVSLGMNLFNPFEPVKKFKVYNFFSKNTLQ